MNWPEMIDEEETLDRVLSGMSIARFGDGEINLCLGGRCKTQVFQAPIAATLKAILQGKAGCMVGIPRQGIGPKAKFWAHYMNRETISLFRPGFTYSSAFITRPDSAPWIDRAGYWSKLRLLWRGKRVTLVRGSEKSLTAEMLHDAGRVREIVCPSKNAYGEYDKIFNQISDDPIVLLCLGATATILAAELSLRGQHAVDLGHIGMFLRKHERGEPMRVTQQDKAVDAHA